MHSIHVDDCAEAYVCLAEHPERSQVARQAFNLANRNDETAEQIRKSLAKPYGRTLRFDLPPERVTVDSVTYLMNSSQWRLPSAFDT